MEVTRHEVLPRPGRSLGSRLISENAGVRLARWRSVALRGAVIAACTVPIVWVAVSDPAQLLFLLPCAVMMFFCMKGMSREPQTDPTQAPASRGTPAATSSEDERNQAGLPSDG